MNNVISTGIEKLQTSEINTDEFKNIIKNTFSDIVSNIRDEDLKNKLRTVEQNLINGLDDVLKSFVQKSQELRTKLGEQLREPLGKLEERKLEDIFTLKLPNLPTKVGTPEQLTQLATGLEEIYKTAYKLVPSAFSITQLGFGMVKSGILPFENYKEIINTISRDLLNLAQKDIRFLESPSIFRFLSNPSMLGILGTTEYGSQLINFIKQHSTELLLGYYQSQIRPAITSATQHINNATIYINNGDIKTNQVNIH